MFKLIIALILLSSFAISQRVLQASWVYLDYTWVSEAQRQQYIQTGQYIIENNALAGIKIFKNEIYVTVPRWRPGVPSTLNRLVPNPNQKSSYLLQPYPSWEMQEIGNFSAIQYVQSMEIDSRGWMWILDVGRLNIFGSPEEIINGPPKLLIWDTIQNCPVREFVFPNEIAPYDSSFLNDIFVDETNGFAYITDTWGNGGMVIYDFNKNLARRWDDPSLRGNSSNTIVINGQVYPVESPSDGLALTHEGKTLYYCSLSRKELYSIETQYLQNFSLSDKFIGSQVVDLGVKSYSDGMTMSNTDYLYFGDNQFNAVYRWNLTGSVAINKELIWEDPVNNQWPDTFAWDGSGSLVWVSNKLQKFLFGQMAFDGSDGDNFRIWSYYVDQVSYLSGDPQPVYLPCLVNS